jgi:pyridinium-3,5-biscarboxylic acid mononucleotide synthase
MKDPFGDLVAALNAPDGASADVPHVRVDPNRQARTGVPEIVLAERKDTSDVLSALRSLAAANGRAMASRLQDRHIADLAAFEDDTFALQIDAEARVAVLARRGTNPPRHGGTIAVIAAGTSDRPVAREAVIVAREMGCDVLEIHDVGAAGLHRLVAPLRHAMRSGVDAIVVAAGMDGVLPTVVAGLVDVPVIGLPVSVGYGAGGGGEAALHTMLQSCAPGVAVVNIDNGIGAGSMAALIAKRCASRRL